MKSKTEIRPPKLADRLFEWHCENASIEDLHGDMEEMFYANLKIMSVAKAKRKYWQQVISLMFSYAVKKRKKKSAYHQYSVTSINFSMFRNYLKIAFRNLLKNKGYSFINIGGLTIGLSVSIIIGLWVRDEISFDQYNKNYDRIAQVMQTQTVNDHRVTEMSIPIPLMSELREKYGSDFKHLAISSWIFDHILTSNDQMFKKTGIFIEADAPKIFSLTMLRGTQNGLREKGSILLSKSTSRAFFGDADPINSLMRIGNKLDVKVTGVYEDLPYNSRFKNLDFIAPWELYVTSEAWIKRARDENQWGNNSFQMFAQIADNSDMKGVSEKIKFAKKDKSDDERDYKPEIFLHPMKDWHLRSNWEEGVQTGGLIQNVVLIGMVGGFVLLLACINFMNLSTARSEKRSREVGIRKTIGSHRKQLIVQFLSESFLVEVIAFSLSLILVILILPWFNQLADKRIIAPMSDPMFWTCACSLIIVVGLTAGSYPAIYLSSFNPIQVLKGTFRIGKLASIPRQVLVVVQFTISITLIIGTIIVYQQIQFAKNRPIGYDRKGIIMVPIRSPEFYNKFDALRNDLKNAGAIEEMAESSSPLTEVWSTNGGFEWEGKSPSQQGEFATVFVSHEFGKTVGWKIIEGRDFSREFSTDSESLILNETAVKFMGLKNPIGKIVRAGEKKYKVVGVVKDLLMESPFKSVFQTFYFLTYDNVNMIDIKLNSNASLSESIAKTEAVFKKHISDVPFDFFFADRQYAQKFSSEEHVGQLSSVFSALAIFISCLGLFGLASFTAEQRIKEIGIRKVLGASVFQLWRMLSNDFVLLILISLLVSFPIAYYAMDHWLKRYDYRIDIMWWVFFASGLGALIITILTVSYQSIKAALINPVDSLKSE